MYLHSALGTFEIGQQLVVGRGRHCLPDDALLSRQHALLAFDARLGTGSVVWLARRPGRLRNACGTRLLHAGMQCELQHNDLLALLADSGRHMLLVQKGCALHPDAQDWASLERAARADAASSACAEAREQTRVYQDLVDARGGACTDWSWSPRDIIEQSCAAAASSHPRQAREIPQPLAPPARVREREQDALVPLCTMAPGGRSAQPSGADEPGGRGLRKGSEGRRLMAADATVNWVAAHGGASVTSGGTACAVSGLRRCRKQSEDTMGLEVTLVAVGDACLDVGVDGDNVVTAVGQHRGVGHLGGVQRGDCVVSCDGESLGPGVRLTDVLQRRFLVAGESVRLGLRRPMDAHVRGQLETAPPPDSTGDALHARHTFIVPDKRCAAGQAYWQNKPRRDPYSGKLLDPDYVALVQDQ